VLFSDGGDWTSKKYSFDSTLRNLDESGVIVYPIRFDTRGDSEKRLDANKNPGRLPRGRDPDTVFAPRKQNDDTTTWQLDNLYLKADIYLRKLADRSGGQLSRADVASLPKAFAAIAAELRTQYLLGYYPTNKDDNAAYRKIQVKTSRKDIAIRFRRGYLPKNQGR
jgi:VWFA-related protein